MAKQICESCKKELNYSILRSDIVWVNGRAYCQECAEIIAKQELGEEDSLKEIERQRLEEKKLKKKNGKKNLSPRLLIHYRAIELSSILVLYLLLYQLPGSSTFGHIL